jgi:hypothetical protein
MLSFCRFFCFLIVLFRLSFCCTFCHISIYYKALTLSAIIIEAISGLDRGISVEIAISRSLEKPPVTVGESISKF